MQIPAVYRENWRLTARYRLRQIALDALWMRVSANDQMRRLNDLPRLQILYTHDIPDSTLPQIRELLKRLAQHHTFVSYDDAVSRIASGAIERPMIAVALDDGLAVNTTLLDLFDAFGVCACFFVIGTAIGLAGTTQFCRQTLHIPPHNFLSWNDLERLLKRGHLIGAHTMTHPDLTTLSTGQAQDEIGGCRELLLKRLGQCDHLAWPYGRATDPLTQFAKTVGFKSIGTGSRGDYTQSGDVFRLRRDAWFAEAPARNVFTLMALRHL